MKNELISKKGISLIVLIITIVISLILLSVVIMTFTQSDITGKATETSFKSTARAYQDTLMIYVSNKKMNLASEGKNYDLSTLNANKTVASDSTSNDITVNGIKGIKAIIPNIKDSDIAQTSNSNIGFSIMGGKLVYNNSNNSIDNKWLEDLDIGSAAVTLASVVQVGDYVTYTTYNGSGGSSNKWLVFSKNTSTGLVELISEKVIGSIYYDGSIEDPTIFANNLINQIPDVKDSNANSSRILSFNDIKTFFSTNSLTYDGNCGTEFPIKNGTNDKIVSVIDTGEYYWLASAYDANHLVYLYGDYRCVSNVSDGEFGVRPIVSLKSGVTKSGGSGTSIAPYIIG